MDCLFPVSLTTASKPKVLKEPTMNFQISFVSYFHFMVISSRKNRVGSFFTFIPAKHRFCIKLSSFLVVHPYLFTRNCVQTLVPYLFIKKWQYQTSSPHQGVRCWKLVREFLTPQLSLCSVSSRLEKSTPHHGCRTEISTEFSWLYGGLKNAVLISATYQLPISWHHPFPNSIFDSWCQYTKVQKYLSSHSLHFGFGCQ